MCVILCVISFYIYIYTQGLFPSNLALDSANAQNSA